MPRLLLELDWNLKILACNVQKRVGLSFSDQEAGFNLTEMVPLAQHLLASGQAEHLTALPGWVILAGGGEQLYDLDLEPLTAAGEIRGLRLSLVEFDPAAAAFQRTLDDNERLLMQHRVDQYLLDNQVNLALQAICEYMVKKFRSDYVIVALLQSDILVPYAAANFPIPLSQMPVIHLNQGIIGHVASIGQPYRTLNAARDPHYLELPAEKVFSADMAAPIFAGGEPGAGRLLGVVSLESSNPAGFLGGALRQVEEITADIAEVLEKDRVLRADQKHLSDLTILRELALQLTEAPDLPAIASLGVNATRLLLDATASFLYTYNPELDYPGEESPGRPHPLKLEASYQAESLAGVEFRKPRQGGLTFAVVHSGQPVVVNDPANSPFYYPTVVRDWRMHSVVGVPLIRQGKVMGVLTASFSFPRPIEETDVHTLTLLVEQLASHIESARLRSAAAMRFVEMETLYRISSALRQTRTRSEVEKMLVEEVLNIFFGDAALIYSPAPEEKSLVVTSGVGRGTAALGLRLPLDQSIAGRVYSTAMPFRSLDLVHEQRLFRRLDSDQDTPSALVTALYVPLQVGMQVYAVLQVQKRYTTDPFSESDLRLMETIAQVGGTALQQAALYEETNRRADQIQRTAERLSRFIRATERLTLAGDFSEMMKVALDFGIEITGAARGAIFLVDDDERLVLVHIHGVTEAVARQVRALPLTVRSGLFKEVMDTRYPLEIVDTQVEHRRVQFIKGYTGSQIYCAPLMVDQSVIALLDLDRLPAGDESRSLLSAFLDRAAGAIHRSRLFLEVQRANQELEERVNARTAELRAERDRTNAILEAAGEGILVTDLEGRAVYLNPAMERQTGYTQEEVRDTVIGRMQVTPQSRGNLLKMWEQVNRGEIWQGELQAQHKSGRLYDLTLTVSPLRSTDGQIYGYVGVQQDISQLKELDRMKSQFVSNVSHELRTPITNLKLYLEMLPKASPERFGRYLATLKRETERLATLVEDILSISRLDLGKTKAELHPLDLLALLEELVEDRRPLAVQRGLDLEFNAGEGPYEVIGDVKFVTQIATNLLTNAMNYTPAGGRVEFRVFSQESPPGAGFTVSDTGPGIEPEELTHLFERFYRGSAGANSSHPGTGLGLAMVQELVNLMGGKITVDTQVGKGSRFTTWLPKANK